MKTYFLSRNKRAGKPLIKFIENDGRFYYQGSYFNLVPGMKHTGIGRDYSDVSRSRITREHYLNLLKGILKDPKPVKPITYSIKKPVSIKYMDVSTAHVLPTDTARLNKINCPCPVNDRYEYGHHIVVPDTIEELKDLGFSEAFINLMKIAIKKGFRRVTIDSDGTVYTDLPQFWDAWCNRSR